MTPEQPAGNGYPETRRRLIWRRGDDKLVPIVMSRAMPSKEIVDAIQALRRIASI